MAELKLVVMVVGIRAEAYLLHHHFLHFRLLLLGMAFLLVEEFLVVDNTAHWWVGILGYHHQVEL